VTCAPHVHLTCLSFFGPLPLQPVVIAIQKVPTDEQYRVLVRTIEGDIRVFLPRDTDEDALKVTKKYVFPAQVCICELCVYVEVSM
jgi:hypothetical protein